MSSGFPQIYQLVAFRNASSRVAGINPPTGGEFLLLKSSDICSNVIHSTPSCELMNSRDPSVFLAGTLGMIVRIHQ